MKRMRCMEKHSWASGFRGEGGRDWISLGLRRVEGRAAGEAAGGCASRLVHAENWDRANENGSRATFIEIIVD